MCVVGAVSKALCRVPVDVVFGLSVMSVPLIRTKISKLSWLRKSQIDGWFLRYIIAAMLDMMNSQKVYSYLYSNYNFIQQGEIVFFP